MDRTRTNGRYDFRGLGNGFRGFDRIERFVFIKPDLSIKIKGIANREVLKSLLKLAIRVNSIQEFEEKLKQFEL